MKTNIFGKYDFSMCDNGAQIEGFWFLVKTEALSTKHADLTKDAEGSILCETDAQFSNFAPPFKYIAPNAKDSFLCTYKLTPVSKNADGTPTGKKTYYFGTMEKNGVKCEAFALDSTQIKNRIFGAQQWTSQKIGRREGGVPASRAQAKEYAKRWDDTLQKKLGEIEDALGSYLGGGTDVADEIARLKQICRVRAYRHAATLLADYKADEEAKIAERTERKAVAKVEKLTANASLAELQALQAKLLEQIAALQSAQ